MSSTPEPETISAVENLALAVFVVAILALCAMVAGEILRSWYWPGASLF